jgi:tetraacyldisaccharide 4'-kinase
MIWLKLLLLPFFFLYSIFIRLRNKFFDIGIFKSKKFNIPIISVGNMCVGGSGKTPHVEYLIRLIDESKKVSVLSRGYGRKSKGFINVNSNSTSDLVGDEPLQMASKYPNICVAVCEKRVLGIMNLLKQKVNLILLDDAFQHRWVEPGLNILLTKYDNLFINDTLMPLGSLREHKKGYSRANIIVVTDTPKPLLPLDEYRLREQIAPAFDQKVCFSHINYLNPISIFSNQKINMVNKEILLLTGIGNPSNLLNYLEESNIEISKHLKFRDHHNFKNKDIKKIITSFNSIKSTEKLILTTEKDSYRLLKFENQFEGISICFIPIEIKFHGKKSDFDSLILNYVEKNSFNE